MPPIGLLILDTSKPALEATLGAAKPGQHGESLLGDAGLDHPNDLEQVVCKGGPSDNN